MKFVYTLILPAWFPPLIELITASNVYQSYSRQFLSIFTAMEYASTLLIKVREDFTMICTSLVRT